MSETRVVRAAEVPPGALAPAYTGLAVLPRTVQEASRIVAHREELLDAAREEAASILRKAREDADALRETMEQELTEQVRRRFEELVAGMSREIEESKTEQAALLRESAIELACKVVRMSHDRDPSAIEALVSTVGEEVARFTPTGVRIGPADAAFVGVSTGAVFAGLEVVIDDSLGRGEIVIATPHGNFRSSFEERINALRDSLRRRLGS
jgi:flagellar biosynthesis/type III secretory pathway protein FliH